MRQIYETIDRQGYQWIVVLVAGLGFFLDGYTVSKNNRNQSTIARAEMADPASLSFSRVTSPFL